MVPRTRRSLARTSNKMDISHSARDELEIKAASPPPLTVSDIKTIRHELRTDMINSSETTVLESSPFDDLRVTDTKTSVSHEEALPSPPPSAKSSTPRRDEICIAYKASKPTPSPTLKARRPARRFPKCTWHAKAPPTPRSPPMIKTTRSTTPFSLPPQLAIVKSNSLQEAYICKRAEDKSLADSKLHFGMRLLNMKMLRLDPVTQEEMFWEDFGGSLDKNGAFVTDLPGKVEGS